MEDMKKHGAVAWVSGGDWTEDQHIADGWMLEVAAGARSSITPLYAHPAPATQQGSLTDEQIREIAEAQGSWGACFGWSKESDFTKPVIPAHAYTFARAILAAQAAATTDACAPFLKDGETPAECIARNRKDAEAVFLYYDDAQRWRNVRDLLGEIETEFVRLEDLAPWIRRLQDRVRTAEAAASPAPAHSKSEYKRRVAMGDASVTPPASPAPAGEGATTTARPKHVYDGPRGDAGQFTDEEVRRGYAMRGNTKVYCCYGMYCDAGHSGDCKHIAGVKGGAE